MLHQLTYRVTSAMSMILSGYPAEQCCCALRRFAELDWKYSTETFNYTAGSHREGFVGVTSREMMWVSWVQARILGSLTNAVFTILVSYCTYKNYHKQWLKTAYIYSVTEMQLESPKSVSLNQDQGVHTLQSLVPEAQRESSSWHFSAPRPAFLGLMPPFWTR